MDPEETQGTAAEEQTASSEEETAASEASATHPAEGGGPDTFLDDETLMAEIRHDPKLNHFFGKMQAAYTKRSQTLAGVKQAAELVDRFNSDPEFAKQTILSRAQQLGLNVGMAGQTPAQPNQPAAATAPQTFVDRIKSSLDPSLQWLAPQLANAFYPAVQEAVAPLQQQLGQSRQSQTEAQFEELSRQLSEKAPGWEQHEDDMTRLLDFLKSDRLNDRVYGNKLEVLHRMVRGGDYATQEALTRMATAAKNRTTTGQAGKPPTDNLKDRLLKTARSSRGPTGFSQAFQMAAQAAVDEVKRGGAAVPE